MEGREGTGRGLNHSPTLSSRRVVTLIRHSLCPGKGVWPVAAAPLNNVGVAELAGSDGRRASIVTGRVTPIGTANRRQTITQYKIPQAAALITTMGCTFDGLAGSQSMRDACEVAAGTRASDVVGRGRWHKMEAAKHLNPEDGGRSGRRFQRKAKMWRQIDGCEGS